MRRYYAWETRSPWAAISSLVAVDLVVMVGLWAALGFPSDIVVLVFVFPLALGLGRGTRVRSTRRNAERLRGLPPPPAIEG